MGDNYEYSDVSISMINCKQRIHTFLFLFMMATGSIAQTTDTKTELILGTSFALDLPPYQFLDHCSKQPTGTTLHLLSKIAEQLDVEFQVNYVTTFENTTRLTEKLQQEQIQGVFSLPADLLTMSGLTINIAVSAAPVNIYKGSIIFNRDYPVTINSLDDFTGTTAGLIGGSIRNMDIVGELKKRDISAIDTIDTNRALNALINKTVALVVIDPFYGQVKQAEDKYKGRFTILRVPLLDRDTHLFYNTANTRQALIEAIDTQLQKAHKTGVFARLNDYYLKVWLNNQGCANDRQPSLNNIRLINIEDQFPEKNSASKDDTAPAL